jgi:hypothetical protein
MSHRKAISTTQAGTEHSSWALWGTWRARPDLMLRIARAVKEKTGERTVVAVKLGRDVERVLTTDEEEEDLESQLTHDALKKFHTATISSKDDHHSVRVVFVRRPDDVEIGARDPRRGTVKAGVVLEVISFEPSQEKTVIDTANYVAEAVERGRPRLMARGALKGTSKRGDSRPTFPCGSGGSASRSLERAVRESPKRNSFWLIFVLICLGLYAGAIALLATVPLLYPASETDGVDVPGRVLDVGRPSVQWLVAGLGVVVAVAAFFAQRWLFPPVEVARLPRTGKAFKAAVAALGTTGVVGAVAGLLLEIPGLAELFEPK